MALEGKGAEAPARLRRDLPDIVRSNWLLWVPFQFINFRFVPPQLQVGGRGDGWLGGGWGGAGRPGRASRRWVGKRVGCIVLGCRSACRIP